MSNPEISSITLLSGNTYDFKDKRAREMAAGAVTVDIDPPQNPMKGSLWIDTSQGNLLKFYDGTEWLPIGNAWGELYGNN